MPYRMPIVFAALFALACTPAPRLETPPPAPRSASADPAPKPDGPEILDLSGIKGPRIGPKNRILVLGTSHLSQLPETFKTEDLSLVVDRLAAWAPDVITIEAVSGSDCDHMRRYPDRYEESVEYYCWDPTPAEAATGLDVPAATAEIRKTMKAWPDTPTAADRRRLASLFLAGGDRVSALVQWLRLAGVERVASDGLNAALVEVLETVRTRPGETWSIAAPLAARLGLERVHPTDDHTADSPSDNGEAYGAALAAAWDNPALEARLARDDALMDGLGSPEGVLAMYRGHNAPETAPLVIDSDFAAALEDPSPEMYGRQYVGYWETRNLRMAANIRDVLARDPGRRVLAIVGASHKPYFDDYLNRMHDVEIVDASAVLK